MVVVVWVGVGVWGCVCARSGTHTEGREGSMGCRRAISCGGEEAQSV